MKTKKCPMCGTEVLKDPQHCPFCQCGLRDPRLNKVGKAVLVLVPTSIIILLIVLVRFFMQVPDLSEQNVSEWAVLLSKCGAAVVVWYLVFKLIAQLEFLVTTE